MPYAIENTVALPPMTSAIIRTAVAVSAGARVTIRAPYRTSCHICSATVDTQTARVRSVTPATLPMAIRAARSASSAEAPRS